MNIDEEIKRVSDKIIECNEAYQRGERLIDDAEYDQMVEWLRHISPNHPLVSKVQNDVKTLTSRNLILVTSRCFL